jgi:hypothetical protein
MRIGLRGCTETSRGRRSSYYSGGWPIALAESPKIIGD